MGQYSFDMDKYIALARQVAADGCVLLKNDNEALPLRKNDRVAVFGRIAHSYYKSGLGSGGLVNTRYVVGILDALKQELLSILKKTEDSLRIYPVCRDCSKNVMTCGNGSIYIPSNFIIL